ncbi:Uncharacterised protein [Nocardia cyriacigeorgica]|uniref:Uncharacterized protein n=1 Tax=Nocardia cyriacigeorgica TaxID=135487 RepID=A0A4U8VZV9_9NOCA|nr:Uncharacterised protein [Nocardia cyriacigeorgica]
MTLLSGCHQFGPIESALAGVIPVSMRAFCASIPASLSIAWLGTRSAQQDSSVHGTGAGAGADEPERVSTTTDGEKSNRFGSNCPPSGLILQIVPTT